MSEVNKQLKVSDVKGKKTIRSGYKLIPYPEIEQILQNGGEAFVEGIDRRNAYAAAMTLTKRLGVPIKQEKRVLVTGETKDKGMLEGIEGYIFVKQTSSSS